jgi:hypothetical protein
MKWDGESSVTCRQCERTWPAEKVRRNFYVVSRKLYHDGYVLHILWGVKCRYCVTRDNKLKYARKKLLKCGTK